MKGTRSSNGMLLELNGIFAIGADGWRTTWDGWTGRWSCRGTPERRRHRRQTRPKREISAVQEVIWWFGDLSVDGTPEEAFISITNPTVLIHTREISNYLSSEHTPSLSFFLSMALLPFLIASIKFYNLEKQLLTVGFFSYCSVVIFPVYHI